MTQWVAKHPDFYGSYESKVSTAALAKLLQYGVNSNDSRLGEIRVRGDEVFTEGRATRSSRNKPNQWTEVPLLAKLLKLLINEIQGVLEEVTSCEDVYSSQLFNLSPQAECDDDSDEDDDEGWEADSQDSQESGGGGRAGDGRLDLDKLLAPAEDYLDTDLEDEDPDCKADPLYSLDMRQHLLSFLREFSNQPCFPHFAPHLNPAEQQTLRSLCQAN